MSCQLQIYSMMAKIKYDDVEEEDGILDDLLNQHYDELEKQQYGGEISDDQLNELYEQLDQQQLDALNVDLGVEQSSGALFKFEFQNAGLQKNWKKAADKQRCEATLKQTRTPSQGENIGKEITNALAR